MNTAMSTSTFGATKAATAPSRPMRARLAGAAVARLGAAGLRWAAPAAAALGRAKRGGAVQAGRRPLMVQAAADLEDKEEIRRKVNVILGPYLDGAVKVTAKKITVTDEEVEAAFAKAKATTHKLERVNFTGSGAQLGHTVKVNFEGMYADGDQAGTPIKGTKAKNFELTLEEGRDAPWCDFVTAIVEAGMGQMESKTFLSQFPQDYAAKPLRGVRARFTVNVLEIATKVALEPDTRPEDEQRASIRSNLEASAQRVMDAELDVEIKKVLQESCDADVQKVAESVSWAKFGEKSLAEFAWNMILEEIGNEQGLEFEDIKAFLRKEADVTWA